MESTFKPTQVTMEDVGERFRSSKKHIIWHFELDNEKHAAELECSYLTNKRRVTFDGTLMFTGYKPIGGVFQYRFFHMKHVITIDNPGAEADLLVDSLSFNDLYGQKIWERMYGKDSAHKQHKEQVHEYPAETFKKAGEENIQAKKIDLIGEKPKNEVKMAKEMDLLEDLPNNIEFDLLPSNAKPARNKLKDDFLELDAEENKGSDLLSLEGLDIKPKENTFDAVFDQPKPANKQTTNLDLFADIQKIDNKPKVPGNTLNMDLFADMQKSASLTGDIFSKPAVNITNKQANSPLLDFANSGNDLFSSTKSQSLSSPLDSLFTMDTEKPKSPQPELFSFEPNKESPMMPPSKKEEKSAFDDLFS